MCHNNQSCTRQDSLQPLPASYIIDLHRWLTGTQQTHEQRKCAVCILSLTLQEEKIVVSVMATTRTGQPKVCVGSAPEPYCGRIRHGLALLSQQEASTQPVCVVRICKHRIWKQLLSPSHRCICRDAKQPTGTCHPSHVHRIIGSDQSASQDIQGHEAQRKLQLPTTKHHHQTALLHSGEWLYACICIPIMGQWPN